MVKWKKYLEFNSLDGKHRYDASITTYIHVVKSSFANKLLLKIWKIT